MIDATKVIQACPIEARPILVARLAAALVPSLTITLTRAGDEELEASEYWIRRSQTTLTEMLRLLEEGGADGSDD